MRKLLFGMVVVALVAGGCDYARNLNPFAGPTEAEKEEANRKLKVADELVQSWAQKLQPQEGGEFVRHEGLTEPDPWGNQLRVVYEQEYFEQVLTVSSAGPDGRFDTADDLKRERRRSNPLGVLGGLGALFWVPVIWIGLGMLALALTSWNRQRRRSHGRGGQNRHPILTTIVVVVLAPLVVLVYGLGAIASVLAGVFGGGDGFDLPDVGDIFGGGGGFEIDFD